MGNFEEKVEELCVNLVNSEIQVSDIPDEFFLPVAKRTILDLSLPTMEAVAVRLSNVGDRLKGDVSQKEQLGTSKNYPFAVWTDLLP